MGKVSQNIAEVRRRIAESCHKVSRDPSSVTLLAVTKTATLDQIKEALDSGVSDFGENKVQQAVQKAGLLSGLNINWHMIGHLQTNKAKQAVPLFKAIHSVDSIKLAQELDRRCSEAGGIMPVYLEVNVSGEQSKYGVSSEKIRELYEEVRKLESLKVEGLMTMAPYSEDPELSRPFFKQLRHLSSVLGLPGLSMGMSGDYHIAIEEGATIIRVGTSIFNREVTKQ